MANGDIFGYRRNPKPDGVFSSEDSTMTIAGTSAASAMYLIQNWDVGYRQDVQELFEIGSNRLYWSKGRPQGAGTIGRVVGGADADTGPTGIFPSEAFDICDGGAMMKLRAVGGHCITKGPNAGAVLDRGVELDMQGCVITSIGFSMNVQDVRLMENVQWRFAHLKISTN